MADSTSSCGGADALPEYSSIEDIVESPLAGRIEEWKLGTKDLIMELPWSWVVLGEFQLFHGHTIVFFKKYVTETHLLPEPVRRAYLDEVVMVSEAVHYATACRKLNIEQLGNQVDHLHTHIFPRGYEEPEAMAKQPVWAYPDAERRVALSDFKTMQITAQIRTEIMKLLPRYSIDLRSTTH